MKQTCLVVCLAFGSLLSPSGAAFGQAVMELDLEAGRDIVGGPEQQFGGFGAVDYDRRVVYAVEALEPLAVTAFSLDDGSIARRYGGVKGEGPGELLKIDGVALGAGGVFVAGGAVVNHWSLSGELLYQWRPVAPAVRTICSLAGRPAVAGQENVVVRADDGRSIVTGPGTPNSQVRAGSGVPPGATRRYDELRVSCSDSVAYVLADHKITAYSPGGRVRQIPVPPEVEEIARKREATRLPGYPMGRLAPYGRMVTTADGRLFVANTHPTIAGAIVDPTTGCYELLKTDSAPGGRHVLGLMADSLIFVDIVSEPATELVDGEWQTVTRNVGGRTLPVYSRSPRSIAMRPLRLVSGQPCGGG